MVDLNELKQAREKIRKLPLIYQGETYAIMFNSRGGNNEYIKSPYSPQDYELAILKEALNLYEKGTYNKANYINILKTESGWYNYLNTQGLAALENIKNKATTGDANADKNYWQGTRSIPDIFLSFNEEIATLTKELATANANGSSSKMILLLQKNKNIQQLKEELKDKVLLTASKKELLEKWSKYKYSMLIFQASAGEFSLLWVNSEKKKVMVYYFMDDNERKGKAETEINTFLQPTNLKVGYVMFWHSSNPAKNPTYTGFLAIATSEKMMSFVKSEKKLNLGDDNKDQGANNYAYDWDWPVEERTKLQNDLQKEYDNITSEDVINNQEKHTDYDTIKNERNSWTTIFPSPLTPQQARDKYDEPKEKHTDDQLKPADYDANINKLNEWKTNFPDQEPNTVKQQNNTLTTENTRLDSTLSQRDIDNADLQKKLGNKDKVITALNSTIDKLKKKVAELEAKPKAQVEIIKD